MESTGRNHRNDAFHLVAAVFLDEVSARDAIADLKLAGVRANQIGVALSGEGKRAHALNPDAKHLPGDMEGKHSILWRVRHSIQHDVHRHEGLGLSSREHAAAANEEQPGSQKSISPILCGGGNCGSNHRVAASPGWSQGISDPGGRTR